MPEPNSPQDPRQDTAASVEPAATIMVSDGRRHLVYDQSARLVGAPCGRQAPLDKWQDDDPDVEWCDLCAHFLVDDK